MSRKRRFKFGFQATAGLGGTTAFKSIKKDPGQPQEEGHARPEAIHGTRERQGHAQHHAFEEGLPDPEAEPPDPHPGHRDAKNAAGLTSNASKKITFKRQSATAEHPGHRTPTTSGLKLPSADSGPLSLTAVVSVSRCTS